MDFWLWVLVLCIVTGLFVWWDMQPLPKKSIFEDGWEIVQKEKQDEEDA